MNETILIIDDDDLVRQLVARYIQRGGYTAITASNGPAGIELYRAQHPDLVVLDIAMPGMSGFEVVTAVRSIEREENRPRTPVVLLTAYTRSFFLSVGSDKGIDSYLTKPISPDQLLSHITRFLVGKPALSSGGC